MINDELERWKAALTLIEECEARLFTIIDTEDDWNLRMTLRSEASDLLKLESRYRNKIKSRETLKKALEDSLASPDKE